MTSVDMTVLWDNGFHSLYPFVELSYLQRPTSEVGSNLPIESWCGCMRDSQKYTSMRGWAVVQKAIHEVKISSYTWWCTVSYVYSCGDFTFPKPLWHACTLQHCSSSFSHGPVCPSVTPFVVAYVAPWVGGASPASPCAGWIPSIEILPHNLIVPLWGSLYSVETSAWNFINASKASLLQGRKVPIYSTWSHPNNEVVEVVLNRLGLHGSSEIHVYEIKRAGTVVSWRFECSLGQFS